VWPRSGRPGPAGPVVSDSARLEARCRATEPCQYKDKSTATPSTGRSRVQARPSRWRPAPVVVLPRHVQECGAGLARARPRWWIWSWRYNDPGSKLRAPYKCGSWRCEACARHEASVTFARIREACEGLDPEGFVFGVLTLDRDGYAGGEPWSDVTTAYRAIGRLCARWMRGVRQWMRAEGMTPLGREWCAVVEAHRSGWPHLNVMMYAPELARAIAAEYERDRADGRTHRQATLMRGPMLAIARASGWGPQSTVERCRSAEALTGYLLKLARQHDAAVGEVAKVTQAPTAAPERFRRLRSGRGWLPPRHHDPEVTGTLVRRVRRPDGTTDVLPLHAVAPSRAADVESACRAEERLVDAEEVMRALRARGDPVAMLVPPAPVVTRHRTGYVIRYGDDGQPNHRRAAPEPHGVHSRARDTAGSERDTPRIPGARDDALAADARRASGRGAPSSRAGPRR
jgi:hypothetical protein